MEILDILILGSGPAALCLASELAKQDLNIKGISTKSPNEKWENTYGIWASELEELGLESLLSHRWCETVSFFGNGNNKKGNIPTKHNYDYGLINQEAFQNELLKKCKGIEWLNETAKDIKQKNKLSEVICFSGLKINARLVIDASGHKSNFIKRPVQNEIAQQAEYGIVGKFSSPPVNKDQFVLMDYRNDHLNEEQRKEPPTFLYAMDMGNGKYFLEETSLGLVNPLTMENLKERLEKRLSYRNISITSMQHEELGLFLPMNMPIPDFKQQILGYGGAASMVHPASGYLIGNVLRRAPLVAKAVSEAIKNKNLSTYHIARNGWET